MSKKAFFVLYTGDDWHKKNPKNRPGTAYMYDTWQKVCDDLGLDLMRGSIQWFKNGSFIKAWHHVGPGQWKKVKGPIVAEAVLDKTKLFDDNGHFLPQVFNGKKQIERVFNILNLPEFSFLIDSKLNQAALFGDFMPPTKVHAAGTFVKNTPGKQVVLKKIFGSGGETVSISKKKSFRIKETMVEQAFIKGVDKAGELKDVRVLFVDHKPLYAYHRIAKKGSLYTNVHQGASTELIELPDIQKVLKVSEQILDRLRLFPRKILSLDFLVESKTGQPWLIEANSMPGFEVFFSAKNKMPEEREKMFMKVLREITSYMTKKNPNK